MGIPHPIPYQGSKRNLSSTILTYLPTDTNPD
jgi:site-specific DNA-adenine methylase